MNLTPIMGKSQFSKKQLLGYFNKKTKSREYKLTCTIEELIEYYITEGGIENVRGDIAFIQGCLETGFFKYGGIVNWNQNNFCGLGALDGNSQGRCATFESARMGVRAQIQHLKAYASTEQLELSQVDPRFKYVIRGSAEYVEYLGIPDNPLTTYYEEKPDKIKNGVGWASRKGYGKLITDMLKDVSEIKDDVKKEEPKQQIQDNSTYKLKIDGFNCGNASLSDGKLTLSIDELENRFDIHIDTIQRTIDIKTKPLYVRC